MTNTELHRRLEQIRKSGVPYRERPGDKRPNFIGANEVIGRLGQTQIPEFIIGTPKSNLEGWGRPFQNALNDDSGIRKDFPQYYAELFAKALGDPDNPKQFLRDSSFEKLRLHALEIHAIYDPESNTTYEFILPHSELLVNKGR
jgi:hypothetical protein